MDNYTQIDILNYLKDNLDLLGYNNKRTRYILDRRNYIKHILYCKFKLSEQKVSEILKIKRLAVHHSKYHAYFWKK